MIPAPIPDLNSLQTLLSQVLTSQSSPSRVEDFLTVLAQGRGNQQPGNSLLRQGTTGANFGFQNGKFSGQVNLNLNDFLKPRRAPVSQIPQEERIY